MLANYHTHTRWSNDASGEIEDYVQKAIVLGFKDIAITEHVPHENTPSHFNINNLVAFDKELNRIITKYGNKINILKGFECEYYPETMRFYGYLKECLGYNFLILGQHICGPKQEINSFNITTSEELELYGKDICNGLKTGMFVMLAHPDVALTDYPSWDRTCEKVFREIFTTCDRLHIPVELNAKGFRNQAGYPSEEAIRFSKRFNLRYLVNSDTHNLSDLCDEAVINLEHYAAKLGIKQEPIFPWEYVLSVPQQEELIWYNCPR